MYFQDTHRIYEMLKRLIGRIFGESTHGEGGYLLHKRSSIAAAAA